jgi:hypothetical protein
VVGREVSVIPGELEGTVETVLGGEGGSIQDDRRRNTTVRGAGISKGRKKERSRKRSECFDNTSPPDKCPDCTTLDWK